MREDGLLAPVSDSDLEWLRPNLDFGLTPEEVSATALKWTGLAVGNRRRTAPATGREHLVGLAAVSAF